ncbi:hypothetical protein Tco_0167809 [Tanacetum coccineum]
MVTLAFNHQEQYEHVGPEVTRSQEDKMVEENVPAPTRTDDQLVHVKACLPIGKSNLLMNLQKIQKNPIFCISVDILQNTNFFRAFTASASIYIHQFWNTLGKDTKTGEIKNFFSDMANLKVPTKKPKPPVIPYGRFTKLIIYYLGSRHNIHRRPQSHVHITTDDYPLGNLKFVKRLRRRSKLQKLESKQPAPAEQLKPAKKKISNPTPSKKIRKGKRFDHLVNEEDEEGQPASEPQVEDDEYNLKRGIQMSLKSLQALIGGVVVHEPDSGFIQKLPDVEGNGKGIRQTPVTHDASTRPSAQPQDDTSTNVVHDTSSLADSTNNAETAADMEQSNSKNDTEILNVVEEQGEEVSNTMALDERTSSVPPLSTPIINLSPPKLVLPPVQEPIFTTTTATTTTLSPPPPPPLQSITDPNLATYVSVLEKISDDFEQKNKLQDKTTQALASSVYKLEHHDLYSKIDKQVNEVVKEAVHNAL